MIDPGKAIAALKSFNNAIESSSNTVTSFARKVKSDFELIGSAAGLLVKPLTMVAAGFVATKAAITGIGIASLKTAGDFEALRMQLETVLGTKKAADKAFQESLALAAKSPFSAMEIVQTRAELESVGVKGTAAVKSVAEAAAGMNRQIRDVAAAVMSLETEPLRRLGIQAKKEGNEFVFAFRNSMGEAQRAVATSWEEAQADVLDIFETKFAGGIERMSRGIKGLWSNLGDAMDALKSTFAAGFFDQAKLFVGDMIRGVQGLSDIASEAGAAIWEPMAQSISKAVTPKASAMGDAFWGGRLQAFGLGGVVNRPTLFRFANGIGLMGEAGDEAIMPLKRTSSGRLGVETVAGPGRAVALPTPVFNIQDATTGKVEAQAADVRFDGKRLLVGMVLKDRRNNGPISRGTRRR